MRSLATAGGNLALLVDPKHYLESDFATVLMGAGGSVQLHSSAKSSRQAGALMHSDLQHFQPSDSSPEKVNYFDRSHKPPIMHDASLHVRHHV